MNKLKLQVQISIDGFIAGPQNEMDWMTWNWDDKLKEYTSHLHQSVDTIVMGKSFAQGFIPHWQGVAQDKDHGEQKFAQLMVDANKVLFSESNNFSGVDTREWKNTQLSPKPLGPGIEALKKNAGGDLIAYGGARFASALIKENLLDEYFLYVNPVALGEGLSIFEQASKLSLKLLEARAFDCGIVVLHYSRS